MLNRQPLDFSIKTEVFEGPLELLLELVERRKLLINDISLATVTDEYMQQVSLMQEMSLPNTAQFIALAATLLLVKSKSLLPIIELTEEEEQGIDDLEERLKHYQIIKEAGETIRQVFGINKLYTPQFNPPLDNLFLPDQYCDSSILNTVIRDVLDNLPKATEKASAKIRATITLEEMIDRLEGRIRREIKTKFSDLTKGETEKKTIIVSFLAILEIFKQGGLLINQVDRYSEIEIELPASQTPRYY
jgi:segregation and condensation protein A